MSTKPNIVQTQSPDDDIQYSWSKSGALSAISSLEEGDFSTAAMLADYSIRNPRICSSLNTRTRGVIRLPFTVEPADDSPKAKAVAEDLSAIWWDIFPEDLLDELLKSAVLLGIGPYRTHWITQEKAWLPVISPWNCQHVLYNNHELQTRDINGNDLVIAPGDGVWGMVSQSQTRPWLRGVVRCFGLDDVIRGEAIRDWSRWSERHGLPIIGALVPASKASTTEAKGFMSSLRTLGREGVICLPQPSEPGLAGYDAKYIEPSGNSWLGFAKQLDRISTDVAIAILGQNLTTDVKGGSLAAAKVHDVVKHDLLESDVQILSTSLRNDVLKFWALYNYGDEALAPWPKWQTTRHEDNAVDAATLKTLLEAFVVAKNLGLNIDFEAILKLHGVPFNA